MASSRHISGLRRLWRALPIDGRGLLAPADPNVRDLIAFATDHRLSRVPRAIRPSVVWALRLLWCLKAVLSVMGASRRFGFGINDSIRQYIDACLYGLRPKDSYSWRQSMSALPPLSTQAFWKIALAVGVPEQRPILVDKLATAAALAKQFVATPRLLAIVPAGTIAPELPDASDMFVKPRGGRRSLNSFGISRLAPEVYWLDGARRDKAYVTARLRAAAAGDTLLVQQRLTGIPELADLDSSTGAPPVLRIMTACEPGGEPYLHAACLAIGVPGENPSHPLRDALRVPISIATGRLLAGFWLGEPQTRFRLSPWHKAQIRGRTLPGFHAAAVAAVKAARAFPGLPLIGWDVILTRDGPVILEGNSASDLLVVTWMEEGAPDAAPLLALFRRWSAARR